MGRKILRKLIKEIILNESKKSDAFEALVAKTIQDVGDGRLVTRVGGDVKYSDVEVISDQYGKTWVEVKMGHRDNLANPRISFDGYTWSSSSSSPVAIAMIDLASNSPDVHKFIADLKSFMGLSSQDVIKIPTTKGGLRDPQAVPLETMRAFVESRGNRYLTKQTGLDIGSLVTQHYLQGKAEAAHYMQAGDDFYMIGGSDPLNLQQTLNFYRDEIGRVQIPMLGGVGTFHIRVGTRSEYYEIQPEVKITEFTPASSPVSALGGAGSNKPNPFAFSLPLNESYHDAALRMLIKEELTKSDKKEIEKLARKMINKDRAEQKKVARKEAEAEVKKVLDKSLFGNKKKIDEYVTKSIHEEVSKWLKDNATRQEIGDITKDVMKKLYRELSFNSARTIDRIKV
tara:strand:- start:627 stop:1823 length:1197 start_codon:yes stop_codon:yes gene_type:complete